MSTANRRSEPRRRIHYHVGGRAYPGDLVFEGLQPVSVVSWRMIDFKRLQNIYSGDLLRTGKITSHPVPSNEPQAA